MKKISIFASIWSQNLWDELILKNEISLLQWEFWWDCEFQVASYDIYNPTFKIPHTRYFEYFPIWIKNIKNISRNLYNFFKFISVVIWSDIVVIGWGWIIYDSEIQSVKNPLNQWIFRSTVARFFRKKLYFYAVWIDIKSEDNRKKLKKIFKWAWKITVRDIKSQHQLLDIWIKSEIVDDPVMNDADKKGSILKDLSSKNFSLKDFSNIDFQEKKVGLALRKWYIWKSWNDEVEKRLIEELLQYIEKAGGHIIFLPHGFHSSDIKANDYEFMQQFLTINRDIYASLWEVYTAYTHSTVDIIISMRLHSIILSYVYGIPQISLSYSQKTEQTIKKLMI